MAAAIGLPARAGFRPIDACDPTPVEGTRCLALAL
jgi:hypothetical protein